MTAMTATWDYTGPFEDEPDTADVWERLRLRRDALLAATDWTQVADAPVDQAAWAAYRQALRDLPEATTYPRQALWPDAPAS